MKATTSGTSGQKSIVGLDLNTGLFALEMSLRSFKHYGLISPKPVNYIVLGYEPTRQNKAGVVKTAFGFTLIAPALHREYALKAAKDQTYKINEEGLVHALIGYEKQFYYEKADKKELFELAEEVLGITGDHCIDFFGAVEHPVLYCSCKAHHFYVPVYSRVIIRDVSTLRPLGYGQPGLLNLLSSAGK